MSITLRKITRAERQKSLAGFVVFEAVCKDIMSPLGDMSALKMHWCSLEGKMGHLAHIGVPMKAVNCRLHGSEYTLSTVEFGAVAYLVTYLNIHLSSDNADIRHAMMDYVQAIGCFIETFPTERADCLEKIAFEVMQMHHQFNCTAKNPTIH